MFFLRTESTSAVRAMDLEEGTPLISRRSSEEQDSMLERFCRMFFMALSLIVVALALIGLGYCVLVNNDTTSPLSIGAVFVAVLSFTLFLVLYDITCRKRNQHHILPAVPIPVASMQEWQVIFRRSESDGALNEAVRHETLTRSLPPYILLSTKEMQSGTSSMSDLFMSAESRQTDSKEASTETVVKAPVTTAASPVQTPTITVSEVESLPRESDTASEVAAAEPRETGATSSEIAAVEPQGSTDVPPDATDEEGVRKRKVTPTEEQKYEPVPEKTE